MENIIRITKKDISSGIDHLSFSDSFLIEIKKKSKIILGPNGVGKTSIFDYIVNNHDEYHYIDYDKFKDDLIKSGNKLRIGSKIHLLEQKKIEKKSLLDEYDIKEKIKVNFEISSSTQAKKVHSILKEKYDSPESGILDFSINNFEEIKAIPKEQLKFIAKNISQIYKTKEIKFEVNEITKSFLEKVLTDLENYLEDDVKICPICDKPNNESIKSIVEKKKGEIKKIEGELLKKVCDEFANYTPKKVGSFLNDINNVILEIANKGIAEKDIINFVLVNGNDDIYKQMMQNAVKLKKINEDIEKIKEENKKFYEKLKTKESEIRESLRKVNKKEKAEIVFNDSEAELIITMPRKADSYSTGELNLMVFMVNLYEGLANEKKLIVIDDPLSSYDVGNQYKIVYDIANADNSEKEELKKILIFTHNVDTINIANSQHEGLFDFQYIEKNNDELFIEDVNLNSSATLFRVENLLDFSKDPMDQDLEIKNKYIKLLISREDGAKKSHGIFHYDRKYIFPFEGHVYCNDYLVGLIDDFGKTKLNIKSFKINCINKIIYLVAIRVWIEKKFKDYHPGDSNLNGKKLGEKINYLFPKDDQNQIKKWLGPKEIDRGFLMSKKVMLNQNCHPESQTIPFNYALNISLDELKAEIEEITKRFSC